MKSVTVVWTLVVVVLVSGLATAQSLADIARKEEERRKAITAPVKVYTNDDLRRYPRTTPPETDKPPTPTSPAPAEPAAAPPAQPAPPAAPTVDKGEASWRGLITEARTRLERSQGYYDALQARVADLTTEFYAREDSAQRAAVWSQRSKILDDMDHLKQDMAEQEKAIAKIEEDARKANVPPGWIR